MRAILIILVAAVAASAQANKETALGAQLAHDIRQRTTAIENPLVQEYVERVGDKLAAEIPNRNFSYVFALIADDAGGQTHEPLSLPGGYIFVPASLIRTAADEAEIAGMLAHAMAHVTLPLPRPSNGMMPIIFMGGWQGLGPGTNDAPVPVSLLKVHRENETRADALAIRAMSFSGYDPEALARYIARVQPPPEKPATIFATLPDRDTRITALRGAVAELPGRTYPTVDPAEFGRIQEQVRNAAAVAVSPVLNRPRPTLRRQN